MPNLPTALDLEAVTVTLPTLKTDFASEDKVALEQAILTALVHANRTCSHLFSPAEQAAVTDVINAYDAGAR